jgi:hypothetical protein
MHHFRRRRKQANRRAENDACPVHLEPLEPRFLSSGILTGYFREHLATGKSIANLHFGVRFFSF